jgi:acetylornithine deacetylase
LDAPTRLLRDLVQIPSVNPMGRPIEGPHLLEAGMTAYLARYFDELGVATHRQVIAPGRENLIARYEAPSPVRTVLFDVHQDTVPTDGMTIDPFAAAVEGGRLYGRGACDIKGAMAAMLTAFARLVRERPAGSASVVLACTVDEEFTHKGSSRLAEGPVGADLAIVAEPTRLDVVNTHKGAVRWKVRTLGVACHSSTPRKGENAIYRMARVVSALEEYAARLGDGEPDPVLGAASLSVGRIEGGTSVNVVPDWCEVEIDRRVLPGEQPDDCPRLVREFLQARLGGLDGVEFLPPWVRMPALRPQPGEEDPWLPPLIDAIRRVRGREPEVGGVPFGTDAGPLGETGLPCYVFGPGDIAQAHTKDEWVDLDEVRAASEIYYQMALTLG